jgi:hypothetical protein
MSKIYLDVTMRVVVETDIVDIGDVMEHVDCYADSTDLENVKVLDHEVTDYKIAIKK